MENFKQDLHSYRKSYDKFALDIENTASNPIVQFDKWFKEADILGGFEANAMVLSSVDAALNPNSRIVLLKAYAERGFTFYTNYESEKGKELAFNPNVSILFFYEAMERQIRIKGVVEKLSEAESDQYFYSRPLESQWGAICSPQSQKIESGEKLEKNFETIQASNEKPQRPSHWGGYLVKAKYFEFWQGRPNRMHNRICYKLEQAKWQKYVIAP